MIHILFLLLLNTISMNCTAQECSTYIINGTKWKLTNNTGNRNYYMEFGTGNITHTRKTIDKETTGVSNYYFSPTFPTEFNPKYIGVGTKGKYMVMYSGKSKRHEVYEVLKFTSDSLVLRLDDDQKNYVGGFEPIRKYKRVLKSADGKEWE